MIRILFVCLGNICRSPMAQFVLQDMAERQGLSDRFAVGSAAVSDEAAGCGVSAGTRRALAAHGVPCGAHTAVQLQRADYDRWDLLVCMDRQNLAAMRRLFGADAQNKLHLLAEYTGEARDIADPWYTGDYEASYRDIRAGCAALLRQLCPA